MAMAQVPKCPSCQSALSVNSLVEDVPQCPTSIPLDILASDQLLHGTVSQSNIEAIKQRLAALDRLHQFTRELRDSVWEAKRHARLQLAKLKEGGNFSRGLPLELLRAAFLLVPAPRYPQFDWKEDRSVIRLASVCRTWRRVALECPELWAEFLMTSNSKEERIQLFLSRSQDHPLTLSWYSWARLSDAVGPGWKADQRLLATILSHSPLWRHVHFENLPGVLLPIAFPLQNVPSLRSLTIISNYELGPSLVSEAAQLNSLRLKGNFISTLHLASFPWIQIQSLRLECFDLDLELATLILPHLSNIINLEISSGYTEDRITSYKNITLPFLRTLDLYDDWVFLLAKLITPNIRKLAITSYDHTPSTYPELGTFISENRSLQNAHVIGKGYNFRLPESCSLQRLTILLPGATNDNLQLLSCPYLLQYFPVLEELELIICCKDNMDAEMEDDVQTATITTITEGLFQLCQERDRMSNNDIPSEFLKKVVAHLWEPDPGARALDVWVDLGNRSKELQNVDLQTLIMR